MDNSPSRCKRGFLFHSGKRCRKFIFNHDTIKIRWVSTGFRLPAKCRPCLLGGKVGTVMIA